VQTTIITTCTNRKRRPADPRLRARDLAVGGVGDVASEWLARVAAAEFTGTAATLYAGRSFQEAKRAAVACGGRLLIVSAGLGLTDAQAETPSYDLTLSQASEDTITRKINGSVTEWWAAISTQRAPCHSLDGGLILAALSRPYLRMVATDWAAWPSERLERLRIFSKDFPKDLPGNLARLWMPYDDRLDQALGDHAGTQSDFAQRALRHFVQTIGVEVMDLERHRTAVGAALATLDFRATPTRQRFDDAAITAMILRDWDHVAGRSGAMLRRLRDDLNVACEQGRFKLLFRTAALARAGANP
jgi:hypothetical protein